MSSKSVCSLAKHWSGAFWWLEINCIRDDRDMEPNPSLVKKLHNQCCIMKKSSVSGQTTRKKDLKMPGRWTGRRRTLLLKERRIGLKISELYIRPIFCDQKFEKGS